MKMTRMEKVPNSELVRKAVIVHRILDGNVEVVSTVGVVTEVSLDRVYILHPGETMPKGYPVNFFDGNYDEDGSYYAMDLVAIGEAVEFE